MAKHLVLVGAGHAHLAVLLAGADFIARGHRLTLITPSPYFYYSGMGPGMLSGRYAPQEIRFHVRKMAEDRGISVVIDKVNRAAPESNTLITASGAEIAYDVVSFNVGSFVPAGLVLEPAPNVFPVKPIDNLLRAKQHLLQTKKQNPQILVAGGGAAGFEICCNLSMLLQKKNLKAHIVLVAGEKLLPRLVEKGRRLAKQVLDERKVEVLENAFVNRVEAECAHLNSGRSIPFYLGFLAVGILPSPLFRRSNMTTGPNGGLPVNRYLQNVEYPNMFGAGDCIHFQPRPLDKVGVYAVRQSPILRHNLMAALEGRALQAFQPQEGYLLIYNLGDGRGLFWKDKWVWDGKPAFYLKEWLDKRFVKKYQVCGERDEPL